MQTQEAIQKVTFNLPTQSPHADLFQRMNEADHTLVDVMSSIPLMTYDEALETGRWAYMHGNAAFTIRGKIEYELSQRDEIAKRGQGVKDDLKQGKLAQTMRRANEMGVDRRTLQTDRKIYEKIIKPLEDENERLEPHVLETVLPRNFYRCAIMLEGREQEAVEMIQEKMDGNPNYSASDAWKDVMAMRRGKTVESEPTAKRHRVQAQDYRDDLEYARAGLAKIQEQIRYSPLAQNLNVLIQMITATLQATYDTDKVVVRAAIEEGCQDPHGDLLNILNNRDLLISPLCISQSELDETLQYMVNESICVWVHGHPDQRGPKTRLIALNE